MSQPGKPRTCPHCGSERVARIVYGLPAPDFFEHHDEEKVVLGGCVVTGSDPEWHCKECGEEWGEDVDG